MSRPWYGCRGIGRPFTLSDFKGESFVLTCAVCHVDATLDFLKTHLSVMSLSHWRSHGVTDTVHFFVTDIAFAIASALCEQLHGCA